MSVSRWYWEAYSTLTGSVLAFSADAEWLITFDKPFARRAAKLKLKPTVQAPWWRNP